MWEEYTYKLLTLPYLLILSISYLVPYNKYIKNFRIIGKYIMKFGLIGLMCSARNPNPNRQKSV